MTLRRQVTFWAAALAALIALLWLLNQILLPFIAGLVLAYFLDPVADALERRGLPRLAATLIILLCAVLGFIAIFVLVVPVLSDQIGKFAGQLPEYFRALTGIFEEAAPQWLKDMLERRGANGEAMAGDMAARAAGWVGTVLSSLWSGGVAIVNVISLLVVTPVVAFYILNDWDHMVAKVDNWLPRDHADTIRELARQMDRSMAGFIRGQGTVCIILGIFYAIALSFTGLNFGLLIGLGAGLISFVPFAGATVGGILAVGTALIQFWPDWVSVLTVLAIFVAGQVVEGNFLSPKLVGGKVGLHPVWLIFSLFAFGYLFGFAGLLLAVPMAAAVGVLVRFALSQYLASRLYLGTPGAVADEPPPRARRRPAK
jgi:predicted PurR-regulated permease PerM